MKFKKFAAALSAAAMLGSLAVVPTSAAKIENVIFNACETTQWQAKDDLIKSGKTGSATIGAATISANVITPVGATLIGDAVAFNAAAGECLQVAPTGSDVFNSSAGEVYTLTLNYAANITTAGGNTNGFAYVRMPGGNTYSIIDKGVTGEYSGKYTKTVTCSTDQSSAQIQLYARDGVGTIKYSNIKLVKEYTSADTAPEGAKVVLTKNDSTIYSYYDDLATAIADASNGDTIKLLDDITVDALINASKTITIDGNNKNLTLNKNVEFTGGTVTINNLDTNGNSKIDAKSSTVMNVTDSTINNLQYGGNRALNKGTVKNSTIKSLTTYGNISLVNTVVTEFIIPNINNGSDQPAVNADSASTITKTTVTKIGETAVLPYTLFTGSIKPAHITVPGGYTYADGIIKKAHAEAFTFTKTASEFGENAQVKVVFQNDTKGTTSELIDTLGTSFTGDGSAKIAVVITNIAEGYSVQSVTIE